MSEENSAPVETTEAPVQETAPEAAEAPKAEGTLLDSAAAEGDAAPQEGDKAEGEEEKKDEAPEGAPEKYEDFNAPEGLELDSEVSEVFKGAAKELNLSQAQAQGFIDKMMPVFAKRSEERIQAISAEWAERSKSDKEIGGANFVRSMSDIARLRDRFAKGADGKIDADIQEFMSGPIGNHPGCLKLLARVGRAFGEARYPTGEASAGEYTPEQFYRDAKRGG